MSNETYRQFDPWRPSPVKEISRRQIVETHYFNVDHVSYESNQIGSFERYFVQENNGDTVAVLAVTDDGMIPLVEQYRIANHRWTLEIPAGHANNPSERPTDVAKRKLAEEAGFDATKLTQFTRFMKHAELFHPAHRNLLRHRSYPGFPSGNRPGDSAFRRAYGVGGRCL